MNEEKTIGEIALLRSWAKALKDLPSGPFCSEDLERAAALIEQLVARAESAERDLNAANERVTAAVEALRPFAEVAIPDRIRDTETVLLTATDECWGQTVLSWKWRGQQLRAGDFRRARLTGGR